MPPLSQLAVSGVVTVCTRPGKQQENRWIHSYLTYQALTQMGSTWESSRKIGEFILLTWDEWTCLTTLSSSKLQSLLTFLCLQLLLEMQKVSASTAYRFFACLSFLEHDQTFVESWGVIKNKIIIQFNPIFNSLRPLLIQSNICLRSGFVALPLKSQV